MFTGENIYLHNSPPPESFPPAQHQTGSAPEIASQSSIPDNNNKLQL